MFLSEVTQVEAASHRFRDPGDPKLGESRETI